MNQLQYIDLQLKDYKETWDFQQEHSKQADTGKNNRNRFR